VRLEVHPELLADRTEDGGEVVHARIALVGEHAVQALRRFAGLGRQPFEADGRVDEVAQDQACGVRFTI
jgi:hypothetical protein